ncbi:MAG: HlyD family efflux transporter periplasmic adaptor subunit, partial [Pseudomonadota bacterium]
RTLELRSAVAGELVELAPDFRRGGAVTAGDLLFRIDPADARSALDLARIELAEAEAELSEAQRAVVLAGQELAAAEEQIAIQDAALARQQNLRERGVTTDAAVESATMSRSQANQTLLGRRQSLLQAETRVDRARISLDRRRLSVSDAERRLADTETRAPFTGLLTDIEAVLGRRVSANEKLGVLIDPSALEAAFRVTNSEFARLVGPGGALRETPITATLDLDGVPVEITGRILRAGAEVGAGQTGRLLFAALDVGADGVLRQGDFLTVEIAEPPLEAVAVIPATAATEDGRLLLVVTDNAGTPRLSEHQATIRRRQGDFLIVADVPEGALYVLERQPQLGPGVQVRANEVSAGTTARAPGAQRLAATTPGAADMISLDPARRERLRSFVSQNGRMPGEVRDRLLGMLEAPEVPRAMVERIEARMGG